MITTHVLDTARGGPAVGVTVILEMRQASEWSPIGRGTTDESGRVTSLTDDSELAPGTYRLTFDTGDLSSRAGHQRAVLSRRRRSRSTSATPTSTITCRCC